MSLQDLTLFDLAAITVSVLLLSLAAAAFAKARADRERVEEMLAAGPEQPVDVWEMQRELMKRSQQRLPVTPYLHSGVVLYGALNIEELGELCDSMSNALAHYPCTSTPGVAALAVKFHTFGRNARDASKGIRELLKTTEIGNHQLSRDDARALFDDSTDLMVTNAGFANSAGFPGAAGYAEVQDSNLSKANPASGMIDKTADGKWIKGPNYYEPDLVRVLAHHSSLWAARVGYNHGTTTSRFSAITAQSSNTPKRKIGPEAVQVFASKPNLSDEQAKAAWSRSPAVKLPPPDTSKKSSAQ